MLCFGSTPPPQRVACHSLIVQGPFYLKKTSTSISTARLCLAHMFSLMKTKLKQTQCRSGRVEKYAWAPLEISRAPTAFFFSILGSESLDKNSMKSQNQTQLWSGPKNFPKTNQMPEASPSSTDMEMKSLTMPNTISYTSTKFTAPTQMALAPQDWNNI